ncbi:MAG: sigma-54-dependent Fis family transcriptional regulator [Candidatus Latescibacteria bacterium]|nr:sigma-54-dependent Fis family transcriptional regulator [Candidatus Latescibacterota bacterium]
MARAHILIVDDETDLAISCQRLFNSKGYQSAVVGNGRDALEYLQAEEPQLVLTDLKMPGMDGMELLQQIKAHYPEIQVVLMTAYSTIEDAVAAMRLGAADFLPKPFTADHLAIVVEKVLAARTLREENRTLKEQLSRRYSFENIIGKSQAMTQIFELIKKISDTNVNVLVCGASGTGKELIARSIHANSSRSSRAFVPINCGALPEHLVESEIFGYERGAFTGAAHAKPGLLETADGGTFFLDEISELPMPLQVKFLRVLQDGKFRRLGSNQEREVDLRLICATNQPLEEKVEANQFREDLYYRINTFTIQIPPLRDRRDDIPLLANHFLQHYARQHQKPVNAISPQAMELLLKGEWKGNIRELEHVLERAVILASGETVQPEDLPPQIRPTENNFQTPQTFLLNLPFKEAKDQLIEDFERRYIEDVLQKYHGNVSRAAEHSGIDRRSLHRLLAKYHLHASQLVREE